MPDWNILIADPLDPSALAILEGGGQPDDQAGISPEDLLKRIGQYDALIVRGRTKVSKEVVQAAGELKVIGRAGVGVDNIDLAAAQAARITVVNAPVSTSIAVAELTLGLMLSLIRKIPQADKLMKAGQWVKSEVIGTELRGKTLGIIGMGKIGTAVAQRGAAFGMTILGRDPLVEPDIIRELGAQPVRLEELYSRSDFISLHLPLNDNTRGMLEGHTFASMKRGVYLICAARGGVIDETALLASLESGQVAGAALDVFAEEPPGLTALVAHPNVVATPHIGAQTAEAQVRAAEDIANEVLNALNGEPLRWRIV